MGLKRGLRLDPAPLRNSFGRPCALLRRRQAIHGRYRRRRAQARLAAAQTALNAIPEDDALEAVLVTAQLTTQSPQIQTCGPSIADFSLRNLTAGR